VLCDTANLGVAYEACVRYMSDLDPLVGTDDVLMPLVAECDDGYLNDNRATTLTGTDVGAAPDSAGTGPVSEGVVGAGTSTQMFDFKGGIGTASRIVEIGSRSYTVGVLLNTNYGTRQQLQIAGRLLGRQLTADMSVHHKEGSCIAVVATDLPFASESTSTTRATCRHRSRAHRQRRQRRLRRDLSRLLDRPAHSACGARRHPGDRSTCGRSVLDTGVTVRPDL
jgi:L-aminopeptidase/D-esterase-like protein